MPRCERLLAALLFFTAILIITASSENATAYPWVHHFTRPDVPNIHRAIDDGQGNLIVATGDWMETYPDPFYGTVRPYISKGVYSIYEDQVSSLDFPDDTNVFDGILDSNGVLWLLIGEGKSFREGKSAAADNPMALADAVGSVAVPGSYSGYRPWFTQFSHVTNPCLGILECGSFAPRLDVTDSIPGDMFCMNSDSRGRVFVMSREIVSKGADSYRYYVSWWSDSDVNALNTVALNDSGIHIDYLSGSGHPIFDGNGSVYFLISNEAVAPESAVIALNTDSGAWNVYSGADYPLLDSAIESFYIDPIGNKWFGTEDGLVIFNGETWSRFTTDNSHLPNNLVLHMDYNEIDGTYYVVTRTGSGYGNYRTAFSIFGVNGEPTIDPVYYPATNYTWQQPLISKGQDDIWYLYPPEEPSTSDYTVYSYDHSQILTWHTFDWLGLEEGKPSYIYYVGYIGPLGVDRTFAATPLCIVIW